MKKLVTFFTVIILICVSGCSMVYEKSIDSLDEAYFYTVKKVEDKENITIEEIKELLKKYKFKKTDQTDDKEIKTYYQFTSDNNDILTIKTIKPDKDKTEKIEDISYYISDRRKTTQLANSILLSYKNEDSAKKFNITCNADDLDTFKKISDIVDDKNNRYIKTYNKITEDMYSKNSLTLKDMEKMMGEKPISEKKLDRFDHDNQGKKYKVSRDRYNNDYENMYINYVNDKHKVGRVSYTKSYTKISQKYDIQVDRSTFVVDIREKRVIFAMFAYIENPLAQEEIFNIIKKVI
ncbi:MAG: hypothetical protein ACRCX2_29695 [Paraclostridium sp.]